jgi:hypothetical protein
MHVCLFPLSSYWNDLEYFGVLCADSASLDRTNPRSSFDCELICHTVLLFALWDTECTTDEVWKPSPTLIKTDNVYSVSSSAYNSDVPLTHSSTTQEQRWIRSSRSREKLRAPTGTPSKLHRQTNLPQPMHRSLAVDYSVRCVRQTGLLRNYKTTNQTIKAWVSTRMMGTKSTQPSIRTTTRSATRNSTKPTAKIPARALKTWKTPICFR